MPQRRIILEDSVVAPADDKAQGHVPSYDVTKNKFELDYRMNWKGEYTSGTYYRNEVVGTIYGIAICTVGSTTNPPVFGSLDWSFLTFYGIGAMLLSSPPASGADLGTGWNVVDQYDTIAIDGPGIDYNVTTGTFAATIEGFWELTFSLGFTHNTVNAGRVTNARLWDVTQGVQVGNVIPIGIGRDLEASFISTTARFPISTGNNLGNEVRLEIGGGDIVSSVSYNILRIDNTWVAPYFSGPITG